MQPGPTVQEEDTSDVRIVEIWIVVSKDVFRSGFGFSNPDGDVGIVECASPDVGSR